MSFVIVQYLKYLLQTEFLFNLSSQLPIRKLAVQLSFKKVFPGVKMLKLCSKAARISPTSPFPARYSPSLPCELKLI